MEPKECAFTQQILFEDSDCSIPGDILFQETIKTHQDDKKRLLNTLTHLIQQRFDVEPDAFFRLHLSIDEGLQNAFSHGNKSDPDKHIEVILFEADDHWGVVIKDEGEGFDPAQVKDPRTMECLTREHGRGLFIMHKYMDRMIYYNDGATLKLVKDKK